MGGEPALPASPFFRFVVGLTFAALTTPKHRDKNMPRRRFETTQKGNRSSRLRVGIC